MDTVKATGRIEIIKLPSGEAPIEVRIEWIGLVLPCYPICGFYDSLGALSGKHREHATYGFLVPQDQALEILRSKSSLVALWWNDRGFPKPHGHFIFAQNEAKIVSGVTLQKIRMWPEEGVGSHDFRP